MNYRRAFRNNYHRKGLFWDPHCFNSLLPSEAIAECGPTGRGNVTEGIGHEKHRVKDSGAHRTDKRQRRTLSQEENDLLIQLQGPALYMGMVKGSVFIQALVFSMTH